MTGPSLRWPLAGFAAGALLALVIVWAVPGDQPHLASVLGFLLPLVGVAVAWMLDR